MLQPVCIWLFCTLALRTEGLKDVEVPMFSLHPCNQTENSQGNFLSFAIKFTSEFDLFFCYLLKENQKALNTSTHVKSKNTIYSFRSFLVMVECSSTYILVSIYLCPEYIIGNFFVRFCIKLKYCFNVGAYHTFFIVSHKFMQCTLT